MLTAYLAARPPPAARWVTGLIVGFGNRRPDVLIQRKFTM